MQCAAHPRTRPTAKVRVNNSVGNPRPCNSSAVWNSTLVLFAPDSAYESYAGSFFSGWNQVKGSDWAAQICLTKFPSVLLRDANIPD